jgi:hypothetical protein
MKMTDDEIRKKAIAGMIRIEGLLRTKALLAEKQLWLVVDKEDVRIINHRPTSEKLICKIARNDCVHGLTSVKWNNCLLSLMEFVRSWDTEVKANA